MISTKVTDTPDYVKDLVIYEIATKSFTSPDGPESGTFASLSDKMEYLKDLGINGIWLSGHQLCDKSHFYNIWTEYACIRPDRIDPGLGTEGDFKKMIQCAHENGIRVFLDVITHGVMENSPLIEEHPDWFRGGSWGMKDFDWYGGHTDLDEWWMNTWVEYVVEYGIDGYRLDVAHYRNDLWAEIRRRCGEAGRNILIIAETGPAVKGVTDIIQQGEIIGNNLGRNPSIRLIHDAAGYCNDRVLRKAERYEVDITYEDGTVQTSRGDAWHQKSPVLQIIAEESSIEKIECRPYAAEYISQTGRLRIGNAYRTKKIKNIVVDDRENHKWNLDLTGVLEVDYNLKYRWENGDLIAEFPLRIQEDQYLSLQVSCHDNGWDGYPENENPYTVRGSRCLFGYSALLAPGIPIFMSGEEFDADYRPLPTLTPDLYGKEKDKRGRWLYGSWLDWSQLENPHKQQMLEDVKTLIRIRREYSNLIIPYKMGQTERNCYALDGEWEDELPRPYLYRSQDEEEMLVVAGNDQDRDCMLKMDLSRFTDPEACYKVRTLFGTGDEVSMTGAEIRDKTWTILRDNSKNGGLLVLHLKKER